MKWKIASASARGSSHVRTGRPNQDACEHGTGPQGGPLKAVVAVSDGHGGSRHFRSEIGSRLAAHIAISVIQDGVSADGPPDIPALTQKIVQDWRTAIVSDLSEHPFSPEEWTALDAAEGNEAKATVEEDPAIAYGATLLVVAAAKKFMLYLQLGDGDILAVDAAGKTTRPVPSDDRLIGNQTTSLCQPDAWKEFRSTIVSNPDEFAVLVLASTDGYANSFRSDEDFLKIGRDYLNLVREDGLDAMAEDLPGILAEASEKGSGDDITLSVLVSDSAYAVPAPVAEVTAVLPAEVTAIAATAPAPRAEEPQPAQPRFSAAQIRVLALLAILAIGGFLLQHYARSPKKPEEKASSPVAVPAASPKVKEREWVLKVGGKSIPLRADTKITAKEVLRSEDESVYAKVTKDSQGVFRLVNLSNDPWSVKRPGEEVDPPLENGGSVVLASGVEITFKTKKFGTIALAEGSH